MAGRAELDLRAAAVNVDATSVNYANDSKLEQQAMTAKAGTATTKKPAITSVAAISGGANV